MERRHQSTATLFVAVAVAVLAAGCAASAPAGTPIKSVPGPEARVVLPRTVVTPERAASIPELFAHATELARRSEYERAAREFERVVELEPQGELADKALFEAAAAHDEAGALEQAADRYEQVANRYPRSRLALAALVRATRLLAYLERWDEAGKVAARLLASGVELGPFEAVTVHAAIALAALARDDETGAARDIEKGRAVIDQHGLDQAGMITRDLAALYYALGELRRRRADRIVFDPVPPDFADALERRCQWILDAQSAYSDTMRARDAHWSMMAGYRIGELYRRLHEDLMRVKPPQADTREKQDLFEGAMRLRYSILLTKALGMVDHTIQMAERTGEKAGGWRTRLTEAKTEITNAIEREQEALDRLPFPRSTLEAALADLTAQAKAKAEKAQKSPQKGAPKADIPKPRP